MSKMNLNEITKKKQININKNRYYVNILFFPSIQRNVQKENRKIIFSNIPTIQNSLPKTTPVDGWSKSSDRKLVHRQNKWINEHIIVQL